ncbi:MAG: branched-chain amino acid ABC transporter permease [Candidatus Eremiobacteraeota bacterium]|nr:branched-chain amino acid ABC transporter permease [Candidatus Eremiobacteraeota bacterium]
MMTRGRTLPAIAVAGVLLALAPLVLPLIHLDISIVSEVLLFAIAAMSVNLLLGYTGLPAFGNAAFFGLGSYGAALSITYAHVHFIEAVLIGTFAGFAGGAILGPFLLRRRGIYFGLLAIAFGQVFYFIAYRFTSITGGEDGMNFARPYVGTPAAHFTLHETAFYYVALALYLGVVAAFSVITSSPFGRTLVAIRQNEVRVRYLGINTDRFILVALLVSATVAGLGGAMFALLINFSYPLILDWHQSGDFVLIMILGGAGTLWGPLVGAAIFVVGKDIISTITPLWQIFLGAIFIACVLGFPKGILGSLAALRKKQSIGDDHDAPTPEAHAPFVGGTT